MIFHMQKCLRSNFFAIHYFSNASIKTHWRCFSSPCTLTPLEVSVLERCEKFHPQESSSGFDLLVRRVHVGSSVDEVFQSLVGDQVCNSAQVSIGIITNLLHLFKDDWKSALGIFRWAGSRSDYKHTVQLYDMMVDILGKAKQMDQMKALLKEMHKDHLITLNTIAKVMRRFAGAGECKDAVAIFDELITYGLEKNTESMNILLDTLCKEGKVELAREIFLELKSHIPPNAHTFNILINGWCKVKRVDEAQWTIQEMKGYGCNPCIISYSTMINFYCRQYNFRKVYELLDEMKENGSQPNVVTYTTIMSFLTKAGEFEEALQIYEKMKAVGCKPDAKFYNSLLHTLGKAGRVAEAVDMFKKEMPKVGISPSTSTYNTMMSMLCYRDREEDALSLLKEMETSQHCKPVAQTYYPLLKLCIRKGKADSLLNQLLDEMVSKYHISLDLATYSLLIHGLCRAEKCEWAYKVFEEMAGKDVIPRCQTCFLHFELVRSKNMFDAANKSQCLMEKL